VFRVAQLGVHEGKCAAMWGVILSNWMSCHQSTSCEMFSIDPFDREQDGDLEMFEKAMMNLMPLINREVNPKLDVRIIRNDPSRQATEYPDEYFDVVYVDGSIHYIHMISAIKTWTKKLKKGGFICGVCVLDDGPEHIHVEGSEKFQNFTRISKDSWFAERCTPPKKERPQHGFFVDENELEKIDLEPTRRFLDWTKGQEEFMTNIAGLEHYRLLSCLAGQVEKGSTIANLGTSTGSNVVALAYNHDDVMVETYDYENELRKLPEHSTSILTMKNVKLYNGGTGADDYKKFLSHPLIVVDIDPHDGLQEEILIENLARDGFRGIAICDDIYINVNMRYFWENVAQKKMDLTRVGHWSGTGAVIFDPDYMDIVVQE
jgi:hypothetical protein